jgi:inorganic triphosphatase YgiF
MTTARAPHPVELELKYRIRDGDAAAAERYLEADSLGRFKPASPVRDTHVEDRYVDTASGDLAMAGYAARLRRTRKGTSVGLKSLAGGPLDGDGSAAHRREEIEGPADASSNWPATSRCSSSSRSASAAGGVNCATAPRASS